MPDPVNWYSQNQNVADITVPNNTRFIARKAGYLRRVQVMLHGAIATAAENVTVSVDNGTPVVVGAIATAGSGEGTLISKDLFIPVNEGSNVEVINDGASTGAVGASIAVTLSQ